MPTKSKDTKNNKGKKKGGSSRPSLIDGKFVIMKAKELYLKFEKKNKAVILDKGMKIQKGNAFCHQITTRQLEYSMGQREPAVIPIVRKFYTNGRFMCTNDKVLVHGVEVSFSAETINAFFGTPNIENDDYSIWIQDRMDFDDIRREMCIPGIEWQKDRASSIEFLPDNTMNIYAKMWNKFICSSIMPTSHNHKIYVHCAALLYAICKGWSINVGKVIQDTIKGSIQPKTTISHVHSYLITSLCQDAGVKIDDYEFSKPSSMLVPNDTLSKLEKWPSREHVSSGLGFINVNPSCRRPRELILSLRTVGDFSHRAIPNSEVEVIMERQRVMKVNKE